MLSKKYRLTPFLIKKVLKEGYKQTGDFVYIKFLNISPSTKAVAVCVPSKSFKKATQRVLLKRRVKCAVVEVFSQIKPGLGVVIFIKNNHKHFNYQDLKKDIIKVFEKSGIIE
ncbi:MAG: ribonuclease P protein component [Patescibacteria group bacterium]